MSDKNERQECPRCSEQCWRDSVHNGLAMLYGPWGCECGWSEYEEYDQTKAQQPADGHVDQWGGFTRRRESDNENFNGWELGYDD